MPEALEEELEVRRLCLSYLEEEIESDAVETWQWILSRPTAKVDEEVLKAGIRHGKLSLYTTCCNIPFDLSMVIVV